MEKEDKTDEHDSHQFSDLARDVFGECLEHEPTCICCIAMVLAKQLDDIANGNGFNFVRLLGEITAKKSED